MTTRTSVSIQLPDLPALTRSFELRTNKACRPVTLSSEAWFLNNEDTAKLLTEQERAVLPSAKIGLLSALCFPTCDPPQLRFLTDFITMLTFAHERLLKTRNVHESGWSAEEVGNQVDGNGMDILNQHELFANLTPELAKFASRASPIWHSRFAQSALAYRRSQLDSFRPLNLSDLDSNILEHYLIHRRCVSGAHMLFGLAELALGHKPLEYAKIDEMVHDPGTTRIVALHVLETLQDLAADIVALSSDIVSYNQFQSTQIHRSPSHPPLNAVAICILFKHLSAQGATNLVVRLLKGKIQAFSEIEASLYNMRRPSQQSDTSKQNSTFSWIRSSLSSLANSVKGHKNCCEARDNPTISSLEALPRKFSPKLAGHLLTYVQVLRDYVSGNIHWFYETELYFAAKGEEVKAFGWIFLNPPTHPNP